MRGRLPQRTAAVALVAAVAVVCAGPASAVQTTTYKLAATGGRTKIVHGYGSGAVHDTFVVADLTTTPLTLALDVVGATLGANGDFVLGASGSGFAGSVHVPQRTVTLAPKQVRQLEITIDRPRHTDHAVYAAVTAMPVAQPSSGIGVQTRLALLVEVAPHAEKTPVLSTRSVERLVAVLVAVALLAAVAVLWGRRRRKAQRQ